MAILTEMNDLIARLFDYLQDHLDTGAKVTAVSSGSEVKIYLPFKEDSVLRKVIGELVFDQNDFKKTAAQAFSEIVSYADTVIKNDNIKRDLAKMDIEIAAVQNAMHVVSNQYDVSVDNDRTNGSNHVVRLLAAHIAELQKKRMEKSREQLTGYP